MTSILLGFAAIARSEFSEPKLVHGRKRILGEWKFFAPKVVSESCRVLHGDYSFCTGQSKTHVSGLQNEFNPFVDAVAENGFQGAQDFQRGCLRLPVEKVWPVLSCEQLDF